MQTHQISLYCLLTPTVTCAFTDMYLCSSKIIRTECRFFRFSSSIVTVKIKKLNFVSIIIRVINKDSFED